MSKRGVRARWVTPQRRATSPGFPPTNVKSCRVCPVLLWAATGQSRVRTKDTAQFIGITSKDYDPAPAEAFLRSFQITYPSIYDPTGKVLLAFAGQLPPSAIPSTMIIDRQGRLAVRVLSEVSKITLVDMINDVANGQ